MKRELILGCLTLVVFSSCAHLGQTEQASVSPRAAEIRQALNQTVIPVVDLENVKAADALKFWEDESRAHNLHHFKFTQIMSYPTTYSLPQTGQGAQRNVAAAPAVKIRNVTVRRKNITSKRLLDEICHEANLVWTITGRVIIVKPGPVSNQPQ